MKKGITIIWMGLLFLGLFGGTSQAEPLYSETVPFFSDGLDLETGTIQRDPSILIVVFGPEGDIEKVLKPILANLPDFTPYPEVDLHVELDVGAESPFLLLPEYQMEIAILKDTSYEDIDFSLADAFEFQVVGVGDILAFNPDDILVFKTDMLLAMEFEYAGGLTSPEVTVYQPTIPEPSSLVLLGLGLLSLVWFGKRTLKAKRKILGLFLLVLLSGVVLTTSAAWAQNNAQIVSNNVPSSMAPGETRQVTITVRNTGTTTWWEAPTNPHRLGSGAPPYAPANELDWQDSPPCGGYDHGLTDSRVFICGSVPSGSSYSFTFNITMPSDATGSRRLVVRMVHDGLEWFGATGTWTINVANPTCPFGSVQARVQKDTTQPWTPNLTIDLGENFRVGAFKDNSGQFADCCVSLEVSGPSGYSHTPGNGDYVTPPTAGTYTFRVGCGNLQDTATITVNPSGTQLPDVIIEDLWWTPSNPSAGDQVKFNVRVRNQGTAPTGSDVGVGYFVDGQYVGYGLQGSMAAGATSENFLMQQEWTASGGTFQISALVDDINRFQESNENNNTRQETLTIGSSSSAGCFEWPLGDFSGGHYVPGYNTRILQNFANRGGAGWFDNRAHAGVDLQKKSGSTANARVYATADGVVRCVNNGANYPGSVVVLEHTLSGGSRVYTQYGHLNTSALQVNQVVSKGDQIGTIRYQTLNGADNSHLHFEVRDWLYWKGQTWNCQGPGYAEQGYAPEAQGWHDPVAWYYQHRPSYPGDIVADTTMNVRSAPSLSASIIGTVGRDTRKTTLSTHTDQGGGGDTRWYKIRHGSRDGYIAGYWDQGWGGTIGMTEPGRPCDGGEANDANVRKDQSTELSNMNPGEQRTVTIRVQNTGTTTWRKSQLFRLGAAPGNQVEWGGFYSQGCGGYRNSITDARVFLCHDVPPGGIHDFSFTITVPDGASGQVQLAVQMVQDGVEWFGEVEDWPIQIADNPGTGFVEVCGDTFCLDGAPFRFVGVNIRELAAFHFSNGNEISQRLEQANNMGVKVVRFFGANRDFSTTDCIDAIQDVLDRANAINPEMKFIIALTDFYRVGWSLPFNGFYPEGDDDWYFDHDQSTGTSPILRPGWFQYGYKVNYEGFVQQVVNAFKDSPQIMAWELGNELQLYGGGNNPYPNCSCTLPNPTDNNYCHHWPLTSGCMMTHPGGYCDPDGDGQFYNADPDKDANWDLGWFDYQYSCTAPRSYDVMLNFAHDMGGKIAQWDTNHLITTGFISVWHATSGHVNDTIRSQVYDYDKRNGNPSPLDFMTIHTYNNDQAHSRHYEDGDQQWAEANDFPYIVEEAGFSTSFSGDNWLGNPIPAGPDRSQAIETTMDIYFDQLGCDGFMQWGFMSDEELGMHANHGDWDNLFDVYQERACLLAGDCVKTRKIGMGSGTIMIGDQACGINCTEMIIPSPGTPGALILKAIPDADSRFVRWETADGTPLDRVFHAQPGDTVIAVFEKK